MTKSTAAVVIDDNEIIKVAMSIISDFPWILIEAFRRKPKIIAEKVISNALSVSIVS
jgi:hypothetical protein